MGIESPVHLLFIAVVALVVLGPKRLPKLARALGQGIREFRGALEQAQSRPAELAPPDQAPASAKTEPPADEHATPLAQTEEPASEHASASRSDDPPQPPG